ncbi:MAG: malate synthase A [Lysobacteraceae bacterium]|nr:MAG: malate synthase A [Xanthomonadaceae bacterium]
MSAVLRPPADSQAANPAAGPASNPSPGRIELTGQADAQDEVLGAEALAFLAHLHRSFDARRRERLAARIERQARFDAGERPAFRDDTRELRKQDWQVAPIPKALLDRRVEITGPVDPKMVINALNSGANCYMADFEDSTAPTWANLIEGQRALRAAVAGTLEYDAPGVEGAPGKQYRLKPFEQQAVLIVRPRGWHLDEKHLRIDGERISGALFDLALFAFHNAAVLAAKDRGPYFYLPKLQCMEEAALWNEVLDEIERLLGLPQGQMKVTVLIETLPAAFEMEEILHALRSRIVGLNCGRWDYIFSYIKTLRAHRDRVLPERGQVTMTQPFLKAYSERLIRVCHKRGAHAMGGMAAQIPNPRDPVANEAALSRVRADKLREVGAGHDGTWVAHPGLVPLAREIFDTHMAGSHQQHVRREDAVVTADDLLQPSLGTITRGGFFGNVEVCVRYLAAWLDGNGCVPIHGMMEDAATAEIARVQLWQWLHHADARGRQPRCGELHLDDGSPVDFALFERALIGLPSKLAADPSVVGASRVEQAIAMLSELTHSDTLADFLTLSAYERID